MLCSSEINNWLTWWLLKASGSWSFMYHNYVYKIISWGQPLAFHKDDTVSLLTSPSQYLFPSLNVKSRLGGRGRERIQTLLHIIIHQYTFKFLKPKCSKYRVKNKLSRKHTLKIFSSWELYKGILNLDGENPKTRVKWILFIANKRLN